MRPVAVRKIPTRHLSVDPLGHRRDPNVGIFDVPRRFGRFERDIVSGHPAFPPVGDGFRELRSEDRSVLPFEIRRRARLKEFRAREIGGRLRCEFRNVPQSRGIAVFLGPARMFFEHPDRQRTPLRRTAHGQPRHGGRRIPYVDTERERDVPAIVRLQGRRFIPRRRGSRGKLVLRPEFRLERSLVRREFLKKRGLFMTARTRALEHGPLHRASLGRGGLDPFRDVKLQRRSEFERMPVRV